MLLLQLTKLEENAHIRVECILSCIHDSRLCLAFSNLPSALLLDEDSAIAAWCHHWFGQSSSWGCLQSLECPLSLHLLADTVETCRLPCCQISLQAGCSQIHILQDIHSSRSLSPMLEFIRCEHAIWEKWHTLKHIIPCIDRIMAASCRIVDREVVDVSVFHI